MTGAEDVISRYLNLYDKGGSLKPEDYESFEAVWPKANANQQERLMYMAATLMSFKNWSLLLPLLENEAADVGRRSAAFLLIRRLLLTERPPQTDEIIQRVIKLLQMNKMTSFETYHALECIVEFPSPIATSTVSSLRNQSDDPDVIEQAQFLLAAWGDLGAAVDLIHSSDHYGILERLWELRESLSFDASLVNQLRLRLE